MVAFPSTRKVWYNKDLFNTTGTCDRLVAFRDKVNRETFLEGNIRHMPAANKCPEALLTAVETIKGVSGQKWFEPEHETPQ